MTNSININNWDLVVRNNEPWITTKVLGEKLGYINPKKSISQLVTSHGEAFIDGVDISVFETRTEAGPRKTRIFSERGALKIVRYSNTEIADMVFDEICDVYIKYRRQVSGKNGKSIKVSQKVKKGDICETTPQAHPDFMLDEQRAVIVLQCGLSAAAMLGREAESAYEAAVKYTKSRTGIDFSGMIREPEGATKAPEPELEIETDVIPITTVIPAERNELIEQPYTAALPMLPPFRADGNRDHDGALPCKEPNRGSAVARSGDVAIPMALGERVGIGPAEVNKFLEKIGYQKKLGKKFWKPTELGKKYCVGLPWRAGSTLMWDVDHFVAIYKSHANSMSLFA